MPIKPENAHRYPKDWRQIRERILMRAKHRCEWCGVGNHWWGYRKPDGAFVVTGNNEKLANVWPAMHEITRLPAYHTEKIIEIVLTIAHMDHTPENCADENLKALCQQCHLRYDAEHHAQTAYYTRRKTAAIGDLFEDSNA